ncbi:MAG: hypothetical protein JWQ85_3576, partial [Mucilaginibacter sp.]|nr:hypothetical protein [Mucilaginibacter sp.]
MRRGIITSGVTLAMASIMLGSCQKEAGT